MAATPRAPPANAPPPATTGVTSLLPAPGEPDVAYLVDLSNWARAAFASAPHETTPSGEPVGMVRAVIRRLVRLLVEQEPAYLGVCADSPGPVWQHALFPDYKKDHKDPGEEYRSQIDRVLSILALHRIPVLRAAGFQADDLLATAVRHLRALSVRVVMISRDHDLWQLVDAAGNVLAWDGIASTCVGAAEVRARYGVGPELLGDLLALSGEGDSVPGLEGIGAKTAARLLTRHGSLDRVLLRWQWETGKLSLTLRDGGDRARHSRALVRLRDDAPVTVDPGELRVGWDEADARALRAVGAELGIVQMMRVESMPKPPSGHPG
jgi:DNA polymerase-1